ncbi:MAG: hypothetical protein KY455_09690 [Euryarchaeota archaeon]|nr:hypothetical protein [Euryarchaeota archaeon]
MTGYHRIKISGILLLLTTTWMLSGCIHGSPSSDTSGVTGNVPESKVRENAPRKTPVAIPVYEFKVAEIVDRLYDDLGQFTLEWLDDARNQTDNESLEKRLQNFHTNLNLSATQIAELIPPIRYRDTHSQLNKSLESLRLLYMAGDRCARENNSSACKSLPEHSNSFFKLIDDATKLGRLTHWISAYLNHAPHGWHVKITTDTHEETFYAQADSEQRVDLFISCSSVMTHVTVTVSAAGSQTTSESIRQPCGKNWPYFISISENSWGEVFIQHLQDPEG